MCFTVDRRYALRKRKEWAETEYQVLEALDMIDDEVKRRKRKRQKTRLSWEERLKDLDEPWEFRRTYRMTFTTFDEVLRRIRPRLFKDEAASRRAAENAGYGFIEPELRLSMTLRYLAGPASVATAA